MKKIKIWRVLIVIIMIIFASLWVIKTQKPFQPEVPPVTPPVAPVIEEKPAEITWKAIGSFDDLPGWSSANFSESLKAFQTSCRVFLKQPPNKPVGSQAIPMKVSDWHPVCKAVLKLDKPANDEIKAFFEAWFTPGRFYQEEEAINGLFTGYYVPKFKGSLNKTDNYNVPMYGLPKNLVVIKLSDFDEELPSRQLIGRVDGHRVYPFHTRAEINKGAIAKHAPVVVWLDNQVDRLFLEIQGSGIIILPNGKEVFVGYAGQNGAAYTSIASVLIKQGVMTRDNASMQNIRAYFDAHPEKMQEVLDQNKSFVFFAKQQVAKARGSQGVFLTPGYSLAVDRAWVPLGMPVWLNTTFPNPTVENQAPLERLFIAQDTGGAIKGPVRGDVFWGNGEKAGEIAGRMKNKGTYWLLMPNASPTQKPIEGPGVAKAEGD